MADPGSDGFRIPGEYRLAGKHRSRSSFPGSDPVLPEDAEVLEQFQRHPLPDGRVGTQGFPQMMARDSSSAEKDGYGNGDHDGH